MFSFKINKKSGSAANPVQKNSQNASKKAFQDDEDIEEEAPDFIDGLEGSKILSKKKTKVEKKQLVIPLITKNEWRIDKKAEETSSVEVAEPKEPNKSVEGADEEKNEKSTVDDPVESLKQQAIKELLQGGSSEESGKNKSKSIPILFQNRVPDGFEEDDNMDVSLRPDQSTLDDYERIPIEEYGLAMLRGMGWKETEGIGLKNKKVVDMTEPKLRPKGMGLGAESAFLNKDVVSKNASQQNGSEKEDLSFKIGGYAVITKGSKKGYYGQIESFDEDNNRVILRLAISGKMEAVSKFYVNVVSAKEYKKSSKVINSEKYEEYKSRQDAKASKNKEDISESRYAEIRRSRSRSSSDSDSKSRSRRTNREDNFQKSDRKSSHRERDRSRDRKEDRSRDNYSSSSYKKYDDKRHDSGSSRKDDYYKRSDDRDRRSDYRSKRDEGRSRDRRRD